MNKSLNGNWSFSLKMWERNKNIGKGDESLSI